MTEKEKRTLGLLYDNNYDPELAAELSTCKDLCYACNQIPPSHLKERQEAFRKIFGKTGAHFLIQPAFWCDYGYNIEIGENFYANHNCVILDDAKVVFGDNVFLAPNCTFATAGHPLDIQQRNQGLEYAYPITVGDNVWIGAGAIILPGVTIGENSVIGAGSVVTKDIPANVVAVGNPCRVLRPIGPEDQEYYCRSRNMKIQPEDLT